MDDGFADHRKLDGLSHGAFRLHVSALCYAARNFTNGEITKDRPSRLMPGFKASFVPELVEAGLWDVKGDGWEIHDYLEYNPSRDKVMAERAEAAARMRSARDKRKRSKERSPERNGERSEPRSASPSRPEGSRDGAGFTGGEAATTALAASGSAVEEVEEPLSAEQVAANLAEFKRLARGGVAS